VSFALPESLEGGTTMLVYCHAINVAFGNATLSSGMEVPPAVVRAAPPHVDYLT
jgi:hypothetical protein